MVSLFGRGFESIQLHPLQIMYIVKQLNTVDNVLYTLNRKSFLFSIIWKGEIFVAYITEKT